MPALLPASVGLMVKLPFSALLIPFLACVVAQRAHSDDAPTPATGALAAYVARPDPTFAWREVATGKLGNAEYGEYLLTSQTWRGITWKHQLFVLRPGNMASDARQGLLFIDGGRWRAEYDTDKRPARLPSAAPLFLKLAESIGAPIGILRQVPFAPLFDRTEDALIAYTFDQYLTTGDSDWPLLLPMVKSAVRALDATQQIARDRWNISLESFTVSGASKRGWTTWLTAAVDSRVKAAAPMVIDVLNMRVQMDHQRATWGELSAEIGDYSAIDLPTRLRTDRGTELLSIVDPYEYRQRLTQPKLILLSTNDRYWPLDSLQLYWPQLNGTKHVLYVPNQGHDLNDFDRVIGSVSALHRYSAAGKELPQASWVFDVTPAALRISVKPERAVRRVVVWSAHAPTKDFREARWSSKECSRAGDDYMCSAARGDNGYTAAYAESSFQDEGHPSFSTTTTVCIAPTTAGGVPSC